MSNRFRLRARLDARGRMFLIGDRVATMSIKAMAEHLNTSEPTVAAAIFPARRHTRKVRRIMLWISREQQQDGVPA